MNFFKSVFADDDDDNNNDPPQNNPKSLTSEEIESPNETLNQNQSETPTWGFMGGLIKTFQSKSESVIETYRRDLEEFSTGLKKETLVFKDVASSSLEVGASKAQESLESVGQAFDSIGSVVWNSTSQIIAQTKDFDLDNNNSNSNPNSDLNLGNLSLNSNSPAGKYSRYDAQLRAIQCDVNSYVEEIEDLGDFERWKLGFDLGEKSGEMRDLMKENGLMEGIYKRVVPNLVDHEVFWLRYYYRVFKLEQAESVRAKLVERANAGDEEELSWDVDDDDDDEHGRDQELEKPQLESKREVKEGNVDEKKSDDVKGEGDLAREMKDDGVAEEKKSDVKDEGGKGLLSESSEVVKVKEEKVEGNEDEEEKKKGNVEEKAPSEGSKDSDISIVSSQPTSYREEEEEDLGWDEIEDLGSDDEVDKKGKSVGGSGGSPSNREELRKRLSVAEDDEDLSWDIEDDDEPIKKN